ncbi:Peptidase C19, ubiquitin-specific peptidase, DUSP domain [Phytophthora cinnamomi]|uniref:Peptidase C19, ubiquitin-specific peptidase, DUSP domain n=1 Tax=Phytophthora cinnamomi TaxID=4785 RepID=UPI003559DCAE|nr:Peptidase C19, ubiquitin-specific peptidase, DUSP domain [Phytophthora cinnamomi]
MPAGPLGVVLDGDDLDLPVLDGFAAVSPSLPGQRGAAGASGRVSLGSLLLAMNEYDFATQDLGFQEVGA